MGGDEVRNKFFRSLFPHPKYPMVRTLLFFDVILDGIGSRDISQRIELIVGHLGQCSDDVEELQVQHRKFTKQEIEASLEILADKPYDTDMEKKALFTRFIQRVELFKDGFIKIYISIFGVKTEINEIDTSKSEVELQNLLLRH